MDESKNIPTEGEHLTDDSEHVSGFNVRAQKPPAPDEYDGQPAEALYQLSRSKGESHYRVQTWTPGEAGQMEEDYEESGRYSTHEDLAAAIDELEGRPQYVVLENVDSGEVHYDRQDRLTDDWTDGGRFDRMALFADEDEAARYAEKRRGEGEKG